MLFMAAFAFGSSGQRIMSVVVGIASSDGVMWVRSPWWVRAYLETRRP